MSSTPQHAPAASDNACVAVILAAGKSTRMKSRVPKAAHPLCGRPLTRHVVEACRAAGCGRVIVVVGHEADAVRGALGDDVDYALQVEQRGTGDAVLATRDLLAEHRGAVLVLAGDVPLLRSETLSRLVASHQACGAAATLLTAVLDDATGYGRIVREADGAIARIVEDRDATADERAIREWNPSIYCFDGPALFDALSSVGTTNAQGEQYLTDVVGVLTRSGRRVEAVTVDDATEVAGVNTRVELAVVAQALRSRILHQLMLSGVTVTDPASTYVDAGVQVGPDSVLEPGTMLLGATAIGEGCVIGPWARVRDSEIGDESVIVASHVTGSRVGARVRIGPYANLRPGSELADGVRVGDFVEVKNSRLGQGASASHLSYIGDADVGAAVNLGAGVITCNYDGVRKHRTVIGDGAFVGTHVTLIAPVTVGDGAYVAAGSPIAEDVPADALAIARSRATLKEGWGRRRRARQENTTDDER